MKTLVVSMVFWMASVSGMAQSSGDWAGYVTYAPHPVVTSVALSAEDLGWLGGVLGSADSHGLVSLRRQDSGHWMTLTKLSGSWSLQIHDESARFKLTASVRPGSGLMAIEQGVDWVGSDRGADAARAARMAVGYVQRARHGQSVFSMTAMSPSASASHGSPATGSPAEAFDGTAGGDFWQRLTDGNLRFVTGRVNHPRQSMARVEETSRGQKPFAIVVSCSDSRVPPEILFDQGIGDLFVIRTAGEVVNEVELGSIEYAVEHLGASFLVVLGHERCGAVDATLKGGDLPPNIEAIAAQIRPAVMAARFFQGDVLDNTVRENAKLVLAKIKGTPALAEAVAEGHLNLRAAYYDLDTGRVAVLP